MIQLVSLNIQLSLSLVPCLSVQSRHRLIALQVKVDIQKFKLPNLFDLRTIKFTINSCDVRPIPLKEYHRVAREIYGELKDTRKIELHPDFDIDNLDEIIFTEDVSSNNLCFELLQ